MQGIQVDPGTSQFRRLWATSTEKMMSTNMTRPDLSHSCRLERSRPNPALKGPPTASEKLGPYSSRKLRTTKCPLWVISRHNGPFESCPLCPQMRTFVSALSMSALCHKQTFFYSSTDAHRHLTERPEKGLAQLTMVRESGLA